MSQRSELLPLSIMWGWKPPTVFATAQHMCRTGCKCWRTISGLSSPLLARPRRLWTWFWGARTDVRLPSYGRESRCNWKTISCGSPGTPSAKCASWSKERSHSSKMTLDAFADWHGTQERTKPTEHSMISARPYMPSGRISNRCRRLTTKLRSKSLLDAQRLTTKTSVKLYNHRRVGSPSKRAIPPKYSRDESWRRPSGRFFPRR